MTRWSAALLVVGLLAACGSGDEAGWGCRPGESTSCACGDGRAGVGICGLEGCDCGPVDPGPLEVESPPTDPTAVDPPADVDDVPDAVGRGLHVVPDQLDFGPVGAGCAISDLELRVVNGTLDPVTIGLAAIEGPGTIFVRSAPTAGTTLGPGASARVVVAFQPDRYGEVLGQLVIPVDSLPPLLVPLRGRGDLPLHRDEWVTHDRPKVDLLVVIDNGTSMAAEAPRLVPELGPLPELLDDAGVDFHLAVTTTGLVAGGPGCPGGADGGEDGRFFPVDGARPRILTRDTPELRATWEANLAVGTCHTAPPQAFEAALRAVTPPLVDGADDPRHPEEDDGNLGFYRPEAQLSVLVVSNRADASPLDVNGYYNALQGLKGYRNTHLFNFHAITGDREGCSAEDGRTAESGERLIRLIEMTDGGAFASICGSGWLDTLFREPTSTGGFGDCFFLGEEPQDLDGDGVIGVAAGELRVLVDGVEVPPTDGEEVIWQYAREQAAICFAPDHEPPPATSVVAEYRGTCGPR